MALAPDTSRLRRLAPGAFALAGLFVLLTYGAGCRKQAPPAPAAAEDAAERLRKAAVLYRKAQSAPIPEKYELMRRLIALYDDTQPGQDAHLELIVSLTHDRPPRTSEALTAARAFRDRHPTDARVGEAFREVVDTAWSQKDDATRKAALADWAKHLEERDVADDMPKAVVLVDLVRLRLREERWADAEVAIDTALADADVSKVDRVELLVRKGNLLADKLGRKDGARSAFEQALALSRELRSAAVDGRPGIPPDQIEAEIRKLDKS
jgi:hypothetical protein